MSAGERGTLRRWDLCKGNQVRVQVLRDSTLIVNWMSGRWKIGRPKYRAQVQKTQNVLDQADIRPVLCLVPAYLS